MDDIKCTDQIDDTDTIDMCCELKCVIFFKNTIFRIQLFVVLIILTLIMLTMNFSLKLPDCQTTSCIHYYHHHQLHHNVMT